MSKPKPDQETSNLNCEAGGDCGATICSLPTFEPIRKPRRHTQKKKGYNIRKNEARIKMKRCAKQKRGKNQPQPYKWRLESGRNPQDNGEPAFAKPRQ